MTNFEKLIKKDKENLLKAISNNICIDVKNHRVSDGLSNCAECSLDNNDPHSDCSDKLLEWLKQEYIPNNKKIK